MTQTVRVTFRKQLSDGNYGTEAAEVSVEYELEEEDPGQFARVLLPEIRKLVHGELLRSPSQRVRAALEPQRTYVDDDDER